MSKSRLYAETLSKEDLIELAVISLDELELTESIRYHDVSYDENDVETKLEVEVPYWIHGGEDLVTVVDLYENAIKEVTKMAFDFKNRLVNIVKDDVTEEEMCDLNEQFDGILKNIFPSDVMMVDAMKLGVIEGNSIEKQLLTYKVTLNSMEQSFKEQVLG